MIVLAAIIVSFPLALLAVELRRLALIYGLDVRMRAEEIVEQRALRLKAENERGRRRADA